MRKHKNNPCYFSGACNNVNLFNALYEIFPTYFSHKKLISQIFPFSTHGGSAESASANKHLQTGNYLYHSVNSTKHLLKKEGTKTDSTSTNHENRRVFRILIKVLLIPWYYFVVAIPCCKAVRMLTDNGTCTIKPMDGISNVISYFYKIEKERFSKHASLPFTLQYISTCQQMFQSSLYKQ